MAATACLNGMDGMGLLHEEDTTRLLIGQAVSREVTRQWNDRVKRQAIEISNAVWESFKDG